WTDGLLRLWHVEQGNRGLVTLKEAAEGWQALNNNSVAALPGKATTTLFTACTRVRVGQAKFPYGALREWQIPADPDKDAKEDREKTFDRRQDPGARTRSYFQPRGLALVSAQGDGRLDHAALVHLVLSESGAKSFQLEVVPLNRGRRRLGTPVIQPLSLW